MPIWAHALLNILQWLPVTFRENRHTLVVSATIPRVLSLRTFRTSYSLWSVQSPFLSLHLHTVPSAWNTRPCFLSLPAPTYLLRFNQEQDCQNPCPLRTYFSVKRDTYMSHFGYWFRLMKRQNQATGGWRGWYCNEAGLSRALCS